MRILVIGDKKIKGVTKSLSWEDLVDGLPVFGDYDRVLINLESLTVSSLARINVPHFPFKINEALRASTHIYCLTAPKITANNRSNYDIFPFKIDAVNEKGEAFQGDTNNEYCRKVTQWSSYLRHEIKTPWIGSTALMTRHGYPLHLHIESNMASYGSLSFFPPQNIEGESAFGSLFKYIFSGKKEELKLPDYIDSYLVPGESDLLTQREADAKAIQDLSERVEKNSKSLHEISSKKGILAFKGRALAKSVSKVLNEVGLPFGGIEVYEEDGMLNIDENEIPVEIKGHDKGMEMDDLRQVLQRGPKAKTEDGMPKGILIGNPYAGTSLDKRGIDFEPNLVEGAMPFEICLLSTRVLFEYWKDHLTYGQSLLPKKILTTVGILEFETIGKDKSSK